MSPAPAAKDAPAAEKQVLIFHSGDAHGPLDTAHGRLSPGQSLSVPESVANKLVATYRHIKLAADIIPGGTKAAELSATKLKAAEAEIELAKKSLADLVKAKEESDARANAAEQKLALADAGDKAVLQGVVREFLAADSKKALEALQEKHKDIVA